MISHDEVRASLAGLFPTDPARPEDEGVSLVARLRDARLGLPRQRTLVFIPDLHLLSAEDAAEYPRYHFTLGEDLLQLVNTLTVLKKDHRGELAVYQLGDLFDVWRARGGQGDKAEVDEILADFAEVLTRLLEPPPDGVRGCVIAGNHDYPLHALNEWRAPRFEIRSSEDAGGGDILVLHGDAFSWVERTFPDDLQAAVVRLATWVEAGSHALTAQDTDIVSVANRELRRSDRPVRQRAAKLAGVLPPSAVPQPDRVNVVDGDRGRRNLKVKRFYAAAKELALQLRDQGHDIRLVVIGHTHWARIVAGDRGDGVSFALMDCGAWLENCYFGNVSSAIRSAQIGVVAGDELRLYQLGWRKP